MIRALCKKKKSGFCLVKFDILVGKF